MAMFQGKRAGSTRAAKEKAPASPAVDVVAGAVVPDAAVVVGRIAGEVARVGALAVSGPPVSGQCGGSRRQGRGVRVDRRRPARAVVCAVDAGAARGVVSGGAFRDRIDDRGRLSAYDVWRARAGSAQEIRP